MPLPKIKQPLFEVEIPSTRKKAKYRPFTVKEEKILLIAQESKDIDQVVLAIKQIINNCVVDAKLDDLAMFDLEYLLLKIRAKSVSNEMEFAIKDPDTGEEIKMSVDIDQIEVVRSEGHTNKIDITGDLTLLMKYPKIDQIQTIAGNKDTQENLFNLMLSCIDSVVEGDEVTKLSDCTEEEIVEFVDGLSSKDVQGLEKFFETMPILKFEKEYTRKDGTKKTFVMEGTDTFFI